MLFDVVITPFQPLPNCTANSVTYGDFDCESLTKKIISMRAYFALILLNFIFIVTTTCYFIYRVLKAKWTNSNDICQENISKQWQAYSLKKRGLFGSVLGAIGHLIFSTTVLFYQTLVEPWTCDVYLWGPMLGFYTWTYAIIWRSVRLYVLIRINSLQQRFLRTPFQVTDPRIYQNDNDYKWFIKQRDRLNINNSYHIYIFLVTIVILILIIVLTETLSIRAHGMSRCQLDWGNSMILSLVIFFFAIVVPAIGWLLKGYEDAHGIRLEIWVTLLVGIPCFIIFIIWQCVFESPNADATSARNFWGPGNWILFVTTTNHIMSIVLPTFKTLSIQHKSKAGSAAIDNKESKPTMIKKTRIACRLSILASPDLLISAPTISSPSPPLQSQNRKTLKLTTESLEENLCDPFMRGILREWAIKDFSVENVLFYEFYLSLVQKVHLYRAKNTPDHIPHNEPDDKKSIIQESPQKLYSNSKLKERYNSYTPFSLSSTSITTQNDLFSIATEDDINTTFQLDEIPEFLDFYDNFIKDNAPLQVNISYKAREKIDQIFQPLESSSSDSHTKNQQLYSFNDNSMSFVSDKTYIKSLPLSYQPLYETISTNSSSPNSPNEEKQSILSSFPPSHSNINMSLLPSVRISLDLFESVRKEVFWNIFSGVYPKVVDAYIS